MKLAILELILIFLTSILPEGILSIKNKKNTLAYSSENLASVSNEYSFEKSKVNNEFNKNAKNLLKKNKTFKSKTENNLKVNVKNNFATNKASNNNKETVKLDALMQGWLKYLEMNDNSQDVPSTFNRNKVYFLQMDENSSINTLAKDNIGFLNIPNEQYFFFELSNTNLKIFTARPGKYRNFKESLQIADVIPLTSINPCRGGIEDVGSFAEGYCFLLKFIKFSKHFIWELCADTIYEKNNWINYLIKVISATSPIPIVAPSPIIGIGAATTIIPTPTPIIPNPFAPPIIPNPLAAPIIPNPLVPSPINPVLPVATPVPTPINVIGPAPAVTIPPGGIAPIPAGYVIAEDWTLCNRPCDTGVQTRILDCVDINICMGKKLEQRLCNVQRCKEDIDTSFDKLKKVSEGQWEYLGTWTKCSKTCGGGIRTINRRCVGGVCQGDTVLTEDCNTMICQTMTGSDPNKMEISIFEREVYDECKLLEGNLMMLINNNRVLTHVEVNTQEIQIIKQDDPLHPIAFPISKLMDVRPSTKAPGCMDVIDTLGKNIVLCPDAVKAIPAELWIQRIREFKTVCTKRLLTKMETEISVSLNSLKDPQAGMKKLDSFQDKILSDQKLKNKIKQKALEDQFEEFKRQTQDLLHKEDQYETKLEKQEEERMEFEQKRMQEDIKRETMSAQKLLADMKAMADADAEYKIKEISIKRDMKNMMNEIEDKLNEKRTNFVNKMQRMKNIHELSQKKAALELIDVKRNIGKQLSNLSAKGDPNQCFVKNPVLQNEYCTRKFPASFDMQVECKKPTQFCYMCCDSEIPALEKSNVACCYKKCDDLDHGECRTFNEIYTIHSNQVAFLK